MNRITFMTLLLLSSLVEFGQAQSRETVKKSTDILMFANPAAGFFTTLALGDYQGTKQLVLAGATSLVTSYALKYSVQKERPDGSDNRSFPSFHTAAAFQGASFIQCRYGWKYSVPAYLVSGYVAWGRVYAQKHDGWDVLAGAGIGLGSTYLFTHPFAREHHLSLAPIALDENQWGICASLDF